MQGVLSGILGGNATVTVEKDSSEAGSGSLAGLNLPTWVVAITSKVLAPEELARKLRLAPVPVLGRIQDQKYLLDGRTIRDDEFDFVVDAFRAAVPERV